MKMKQLSTAALVTALAAGQAWAQNCQWDAPPPGVGGTVREFMVYNDALYVSGLFTDVASRFARWTGTNWADPGTTLGGTVNAGASAVWDDGTGAKLYIGGAFSAPFSRIAKWDGTTLSDVGGSPWTGSNISTMTVWDDGTGEALYVGGAFSDAQGPGNRIAKWDGMTWSGLGTGANNSVTALAVYQGDLYLFGTFTEINGVAVSRGARYDGTTFTPFGSFDSVISGALVWDDGAGESLFIYGNFSGAPAGGGTRAITRWDGANWSDLNGGATQANGSAAWLASATIFDDGTGEKLYIGSHNTSAMAFAGGVPAARLAWWNGSFWEGSSSGPTHTIFSIKQFNDIDGRPVLWVGGQFNDALGSRIARWICDIPPPGPECYANCDGSTTEPILTVDDFTCFINEFAAAQGLPPAQQIEHYANCDGSTTEPVLTVDDFTCFINEFAAGCP